MHAADHRDRGGKLRVPAAPVVDDLRALHAEPLRDLSRPHELIHSHPPPHRAAGVPGLPYHALRHTFASTLLSRGVSVKAVADWLGHASPTITLTTYAHLMPADEEVARGVLDAALAPRADTVRTGAPLEAV